MLFPKNRMRFTRTYLDKSEPEGWIVLDLAGAELDGVSKLYLSMDDIQKLRQGGDTASDKLKLARALLGGDSEETAP
jgi:hypothetical protein